MHFVRFQSSESEDELFGLHFTAPIAVTSNDHAISVVIIAVEVSP